MKKLFYPLLFLTLLSIKGFAEPTTYFSRNTLAAATTNYVFIDRSASTTTTATTRYFGHDLVGTAYDTYINRLELEISSGTTKARLGFIYAVYTSSVNVHWFEEINRKAVEIPGRLDRDYRDIGGLRLSRENKEFILPGNKTTAITSSGSLQIYDSSLTCTPAVGDVLLEVTAADVYAAVKARAIYNVK